MHNERLEKIGVRKIDELGRIVIPREIRRSLEIDEGDALEFFVSSSSIVIRKYVNVCLFCGSYDNLIKFRDKLVCKDCVKYLSSLIE